MTIKILVVDDVDVMRQSLINVLDDEKYEVTQAENGLQACDLLTAQSFDIVITDILMPDMDGFELSNFIRKNFPEIKIVAISGGGRSYVKSLQGVDDLLRQFQKIIKPDAILKKPFDNTLLLELVERLLKE